MKKIIDGKRYDTETALFLGEDWYSNPRDFEHWREKLYRKRNGEYFLYGVGGPASRYAVAASGGGWDGGEKIRPLSGEAAREWAEKHLSADQYEAIFGAVEDDASDDKMVWTIRVSPATVERVRRTAGDKGMKLSEVVENAIITYCS